MTETLADEFARIAGELFDDLDSVLDDCDDVSVNAVPDVAGVNSVFALVSHIDGMIGFWAGTLGVGAKIPRDRDAEFVATGTVAQARKMLQRNRTRLPDWMRQIVRDGIAEPTATGTTRSDAASATPEFVMLHVLRELAQHTGHAQICRDVVMRLSR